MELSDYTKGELFPIPPGKNYADTTDERLLGETQKLLEEIHLPCTKNKVSGAQSGCDLHQGAPRSAMFSAGLPQSPAGAENRVG